MHRVGILVRTAFLARRASLQSLGSKRAAVLFPGQVGQSPPPHGGQGQREGPGHSVTAGAVGNERNTSRATRSTPGAGTAPAWPPSSPHACAHVSSVPQRRREKEARVNACAWHLSDSRGGRQSRGWKGLPITASRGLTGCRGTGAGKKGFSVPGAGREPWAGRDPLMSMGPATSADHTCGLGCPRPCPVPAATWGSPAR